MKTNTWMECITIKCKIEIHSWRINCQTDTGSWRMEHKIDIDFEERNAEDYNVYLDLKC